MTKIRNPFKSSVMRREYDNAVTSFMSLNRVLFSNHGESGFPNHGSSMACAFWDGYEKNEKSRYARDKTWMTYAWWRAGADIAKHGIEPIQTV